MNTAAEKALLLANQTNQKIASFRPSVQSLCETDAQSRGGCRAMVLLALGFAALVIAIVCRFRG